MLSSFILYQMKDGEENHFRIFESLDRLRRMTGEEPDIGNYRPVWAERIPEGEQDKEDLAFLEEQYVRFNRDHPKGYCGRSLSVSDIVSIRRGENEKFFYCDDIGFVELDGVEKRATLDLPAKIVDVIDDFLDEKGVKTDGNEGDSHFYGDDYDRVMGSIIDILGNYGIRVSDTWEGGR